MTREQIQETHNMAEVHFKNNGSISDCVQICLQMAINGEVLYNEDGSIIWID